MSFKGFDRMKKAMDKIQDLQEKDTNKKADEIEKEKKKPVDVIKAGDMSPETKALPDEVVKPPKGIGKSEPDMKKGGSVKKMAKGGSVGSASKRADGIAVKGKTRGKIC
jgi:hypothetical protein